MSRVIHWDFAKSLRLFKSSPAAVAVYMVYVSRMDNEGVAYPSLESIAQDTGWSAKTVGNARKLLAKMGALVEVKGYVRRKWRDLPDNERRKLMGLDRTKYYRVNDTITADGIEYPLLYNGAEQDGAPRTTSPALHDVKVTDSTREEIAPDSTVGKSYTMYEVPTNVVSDSLDANASKRTLEKQITDAPKPPKSDTPDTSDKPKRTRKNKSKPVPRGELPQPDAMYETVERLIFGIEGSADMPYDWNGPKGTIAKWLKGEVGNWGDRALGRISAPAQPHHVEMFIKWYTRTHPNLTPPQDVPKFVDFWRKFGTDMKRKPAMASGDWETFA